MEGQVIYLSDLRKKRGSGDSQFSMLFPARPMRTRAFAGIPHSRGGSQPEFQKILTASKPQ